MSSQFVAEDQPLGDIRPDVLLLTATRVELAAVQELLTPLGSSLPSKVPFGNHTYYLGRYGAASAVVVRCDMGSVGKGGSLATTLEALSAWHPRAVIVLGIAFGKSPTKQQMCDVLVAKHLLPYEFARIGVKRTIYRSDRPSSDLFLLDRFTDVTGWTFLHKRRQVSVIPGPVLTGEKLVDNPTFKRRLLRDFPDAIGGEMEGIGAFNAAAIRRVPCVLVKSICDWGDGKKKKHFQRTAAQAAASLVQHVLSEPATLRDLPQAVWQGAPGAMVPASPAMEQSSSLAPNVVLTRLPHPQVGSQRRDISSVSPPLVAPTPVASALSTTRESPTAPISETSDSRKGVSSERHPLLLKREEIGVMGLIATAPLPISTVALQALFPKIPWRRTIRALSRKGALVFKDRDTPSVPGSLLRHLFENGQTRAGLEDRWFKRLQALSRHSDTAILLGLVHLRAGRADLAVETLTNIAEGLEPGHENLTYRELLRPFLLPGFIRRLAPKRRVHLLNAFALCLARSGQREQAVRYFDRLERTSRQTGNRWGQGQSFINRGVTYFDSGDTTRATRYYERAVRHARTTRDRWLLGRSLHNLGMLRLSDNPDEGLALIEKGYRTKLSVGDVGGAVGAVLGRGVYHSTRGDWRQAIDSYQRAVVLARRFDLRHLLGLALANVGSSRVNLDDPSSGLKDFQEARTIGEREGFRDVLRYAVQGEAVAETKRERFRPAWQRFLELAEIHRTTGDLRGQTMALHDAGLMAARAGLRSEASRAFAASRRLAERQQDEIAIYRSRHSAVKALGLDPIGTARRLNTAASAELRRGHPLAAGKLWESCASQLMAHQHPARDRLLRSAAESALRCYRQVRSRIDVVRIYKLLCAYRRDTGDPREALKFARLIETHSRSIAQTPDRVFSLDEQACCYQRMGSLVRAERLHRKALVLAEGTGQAGLIATPLNNLGLLLRNVGRLSESIELLGRAKRLVESTADVDFAATVAKNMALALGDAGRNGEAEQLLRTWTATTARLKLSAHHAGMLHGLANLAHTRGHIVRAASLYRATLKEAEHCGAEHTANEAAHNYLTLLTDDVRRFLHKGDLKAAATRLGVAQRVARRYALSEQHRNVLVAAARGYWGLGPRHYLNAARAYVLAMLEVDGTREEMVRLFSSIGIEMILNIHHVPVTYTKVQIENLVTKTREWLRRRFGTDLSSADEAFLVWPLMSGSKIANTVHDGGTLSSKAIADVAVEDFKVAIARFA